jgi:triosephosphate isomerase
MTNKLKHFVGNWKMFGDFSSLKIINSIDNFCQTHKKTFNKKKVILCVPNTLIEFFSKKNFKHISIGAQNCHHEQNYGSYTGSVNALMLKNVGAEYIILGHSENRSDGDNNKIIKKKIESALNQKLKIIFCIGETLLEKRKGKTFSVIKKQLSDSLNKRHDLSKIIIAYEPIWSIGTGKIPNISYLEKIFKFIKYEFEKIYKTRKSPIMLYGGSVNASNIANFSLISNIDGFLIGGASQSSKKFIDIIKNYYK